MEKAEVNSWQHKGSEYPTTKLHVSADVLSQQINQRSINIRCKYQISESNSIGIATQVNTFSFVIGILGVVLVSVSTVKDMPIVGAFVFPHDTYSLDVHTRDFTKVPAATSTSQQDCLHIRNAMRQAAHDLVALQPDLIIMSTPHGLRLHNSFLFFGNEKCYGTAEWEGQWKDYSADIAVDRITTTKMVQFLQDTGNDVDLLMIGTPSDVLPLRWSEVVPWWFFQQAAKEAEIELPPAVIIGQPAKRSQDTKVMIPELTKLGKDIWNYLKTENDKRIAIVVSCDLSHYHSKDPASPFAWHESAIPFDEFCVKWAKLDVDDTQVDPDSQSNRTLLLDAGNLVNYARCCGYTGLVILQGILMACAGDSDTNYSQKFKAKLYEYSMVICCGEMVNSFTPCYL